MKKDLLIAEIDAVLPQTQCRRCGFSGCRPYAEAIAEGHAAINQCPPGGDEGIRKLAKLLGASPMPLNTAHGAHKPRAIAFIDETACIGCTLCILACPVDAISGAAKQAHTVIASECTGCELCLAPCPVDCISMASPRLQAAGVSGTSSCTTSDCWGIEDDNAFANRARTRYLFRLQRLEREKRENEERLAQKNEALAAPGVASGAGNLKTATIQAALIRAQAAQAWVSKEK
ncbi:MAG: RnfABCDGE type electron transport complex subunit B [Nitrosospira sp.]|nr:RnfABCDGE type electron transport complex subunit B [Nitrosospira sp.]